MTTDDRWDYRDRLRDRWRDTVEHRHEISLIARTAWAWAAMRLEQAWRVQ